MKRLSGFRDWEITTVAGGHSETSGYSASEVGCRPSDRRLGDAPSNRLEALKGKRSGQHSIRINDQWRLCFRFVEGNAHDVEITDYHYRASMMTKKGIQPIHPGAFLSEILEELGLSQAAFAQKIGVSPMRISHVVNGKRPVTAELALLFGKAFGQSPEYWLNLQAAYDLKTAAASVEPRLRTLRKLVA